MQLLSSQFKALGSSPLPVEVELDGTTYRLQLTFKHGFMAAVALYRNGADRVVCKFHRRTSFFGLPLAWLGRRMADYESAVLGRLHDIDGVPRLRGRPDRWTVARDFVPGEPLKRDTEVNDRFFPRFFRTLRQIHGRGIAYVDLEKSWNILRGEDGRPYLIDFQTAFYVPERLLGGTAPFNLIRRLLQRADRYHAGKHMRRVRPEALTPEECARTRKKPLLVRVANRIWAPVKELSRWIRGKD